MDHHHHDDQKAFPFEMAARLDAPERRERQPLQPLLEALELSSGQRILDLGVGTGFHALPLAELVGPEGRVLGADIEPRMLEILSKRAAEADLAERLESVSLDPEDPTLPIPDASVDRVLMVNVYHELPDRAASLRELRRVMTEDGRLLIVDWDADGSTEHGPPVRHRIPTATVIEELEAAGFGTVERLSLYPDRFFSLRAHPVEYRIDRGEVRV